jgi:uncharacterized protein with gpF-like domain
MSKRKAQVIEKIAAIFESKLEQKAAPHYRKYFRQVNTELIGLVNSGKKISNITIKRIMKKYNVDFKFIQNSMNFTRLQAEIEQALIEGRITINNAEQMANYVKRTGSTDVRLIARANPIFLSSFLKANKKYVGQLNRVALGQAKDMVNQMQKGYSKRILKKYRAIANRAKSQEALVTEMRTTFGMEQRATVDRVLRTEIHATNEQVKVSLQSLKGYTHKIWNTERDRRVRDTHQKVDNKVVPINKPFIVGGAKAQFPGDPSLPPGERINCRCYLTFERRA